MMMALRLPMPAPTRRPVPEATALSSEIAALRPLVRAVVARTLRRDPDDADVEDCTGETLRRALEGSERLRDGTRVRPWLLGIARHVAVDFIRKNQLDTAAETELVDPRPGPESSVHSRQRTERMVRALAQLDAGPRNALLLVHLDGLSYREVAEKLGVPVATVGTWIHRARRTVGDVLDAQERERSQP